MRKKGPRVLWVAVLSKYMFPPILPELWWQACFFSPVYSKPILRMWRDLKLNLSPKSPLTRSLSILPHLWDALGKESTALLWKCLILTDVNWGGPGASPQALRERHLYLPSPPNEYKRPRNLFSYLSNPCALSLPEAPWGVTIQSTTPGQTVTTPMLDCAQLPPHSSPLENDVSGDKPKPVTSLLKPPFLVRIIMTGSLAWPT